MAKAIYITKESDPNVGAGATTATVKFKTNVEKFKLEIGTSGTVGSVKVNFPGSTAFVPSVAGLIAAGEVIKDLTKRL